MKTWILIKHELKQTWPISFILPGLLVFFLIPKAAPSSDFENIMLLATGMQLIPVYLLLITVFVLREFIGQVQTQSPHRYALEFLFSLPARRRQLFHIKFLMFTSYYLILMSLVLIRHQPSAVMLLVTIYAWLGVLFFFTMIFILGWRQWWALVFIGFVPMVAPNFLMMITDINYFKKMVFPAIWVTQHLPWVIIILLALTVTVYFFSARKFVNAEIR